MGRRRWQARPCHLQVGIPIKLNGIAKGSRTLPDRLNKCSASTRNRVHLDPGIAFRVSPEPCAASSLAQLRRSKIPTTLKGAKANGYTACGVCKTPSVSQSQFLWPNHTPDLLHIKVLGRIR